LISVIGGKLVEELGYGFMATSIGAAALMVAVAVLGNNLTPTRQYPLYWY
jgi:CBS-domain-containing membrane protein